MTMIRHEAAVPLTAAGRRFDQTLAEMFPDYSRSRLTAWIKAGAVTLDGAIAPPRQLLRGGEKVLLQAELETEVELEPEAIALDVVHEDEHVLVVDKPPGMVTHPGAGRIEGTLAAAALAHVPSMGAVGSPRRPGIVHRLDKGTSGLIVLAKTQAAYDGLTTQLARRTVSRRCLALAQGAPRRAEGMIDAPIGRDPRSRVRMAVVPAGRGKRAVTRYRVLERFGTGAGALTLIECRLETGRTHQIRVHLASLGHPLLGDATYRGRRGTPSDDAALATLVDALGGVALHAAGLAFTHPVTGAAMAFTCPLPDRIEQILSHLRNRGR